MTERAQPSRFLIHDRDTKLTASFDEVFPSEGLRIIRTPVRAPRANAVMERWFGTLRWDCLDRLLIVGRRQLQAVLIEYVSHYNGHGPHRSLGQQPPTGAAPADPQTIVDLQRDRRYDRLGGLIHEYEVAA